jgi:hypothetical protein
MKKRKKKNRGGVAEPSHDLFGVAEITTKGQTLTPPPPPLFFLWPCEGGGTHPGQIGVAKAFGSGFGHPKLALLCFYFLMFLSSIIFHFFLMHRTRVSL